jgi:hypothetical protein
MASTTPPSLETSAAADSLRIEAPGSPLVVPLLETAARIFSRALPCRGDQATRVQRGLVEAFLKAADTRDGPLVVELGRDGADLTVSLTRPGSTPVLLRFPPD